MGVTTETLPSRRQLMRDTLARLWAPYTHTPLVGWLVAALLAVLLEQFFGLALARLLGLSKVPALFGIVLALDQPASIPSAILYTLIIYVLPLGVLARAGAGLANRAAAWLIQRPMILTAAIHLLLLYGVLHFWTGISDYRLLVARLTMVAVIATLSLNVVNGYMGEFSCSHPGFMSLGAYMASVFTVVLFVQDYPPGNTLLPPALGPFLFPISLILGGLVAAVGALLVAIPSFRTRGDYLAIISLAFTFIIKSLFENIEEIQGVIKIGGARGLSGQPDYATLFTVFAWTVLAIWIINNFVRSTLGKALNAVRDGEMAANAMTVNTRKTKMVAFLFAAFWAGVAGGLLAHVIRYINPDTFGIRKLAEVLAMVYFGGLNSVTGSIVGAVGFNLINEALRPLLQWKWIIIPVMLILIMIFRPTGLVAFTEFDIERLFRPKDQGPEGVDHAAASS